MFSIYRHGRKCSLFTIHDQIPKLDVAGSTPVSRSNFFNDLHEPASLCAPFVLRLHHERGFQALDGSFPVLY